jgi:hypothetical protein
MTVELLVWGATSCPGSILKTTRRAPGASCRSAVAGLGTFGAAANFAAALGS